jgi:radical SAM protein with 4Fe4S-binding SPASM domain
MNPLLVNNPWILDNKDGTYTVTGPTNSPAMPEVYQIEIAERCNLSCNFCSTGINFQGKSKKDAFINMDLFKTIAERDLGGSYFVELQHRGEPLLNPNIEEIVDILTPKVMVGLSTNGTLIHKKLNALLKLDYLTISFDAATKEKYESLRIGATWETLISNIDLLLEARGNNPTPAIDLQLIQHHNQECDVDATKRLVDEHKWDVRVRTIQDCFLGSLNHPDVFKVKSNDLCLNPFMSVSIHADGLVTPCCRTWDKEWVYGDLNEQSLYDIWNNNESVKDFRMRHRENRDLPYMCETCYSRSSTTLHWDLYKNAVQNIVRRNLKTRTIENKIVSAQGDV